MERKELEHHVLDLMSLFPQSVRYFRKKSAQQAKADRLKHTESEILLLIGDRRSVNLPDLTTALDYTEQKLIKALKSLHHNGYVTVVGKRFSDPQTQISMSTKGRDYVEEYHSQDKIALFEMTQYLNDEELAEFYNASLVLYRTFRKIQEQDPRSPK